MSDGKPEIQNTWQDTSLSRREGGVSDVKTSVKAVDHRTRPRYEMKYLISESKAEAVTQFVKSCLQLDLYSKLQRGGEYPVVSLYLDSDDLKLCRETLTGQKNRFKLRIRSYTDELDYPRFFEIKRRVNTVIVKSRARIMDCDVPTLLAGLPSPQQSYSADIEALNQFQLYINSIKAGPKILVRYLRRAYQGDSETMVRVTFDRNLCYCVTNTPQVRFDGRGWQRNSLTEGRVILEIKFTEHYPVWLSRMAEHFDLQQNSISKYATSIKQACSLGFCAPRLGG